MAKRTLVTGGTGFLGAHLLHNLVEKGETIRALKRPKSSMHLVKSIADKIEWVDMDILDVVGLADAMEGIDKVYHCAATVSFEPAGRRLMYKTNVEGTANVVNIALEEGIKKLVHVSSIAALGRKVNSPHINEDAVWEKSRLNTHYAISKFNGECEVWRGIAEGLNAVIVNPSVIIGTGYWDVGTGRLFRQVHDGLRYYPSGASGFVDVRDVAIAMIELMGSDISNERFILNGENLSFKHIFSKIASQMGKPAPKTKVTPLLSGIAWRAEWLRSKIINKPPMLTRETALTSAQKFYYDNSKITEYLEDFVFTPMETTIRDTAKAFLEAMADSRNYTEPEV